MKRSIVFVGFLFVFYAKSALAEKAESVGRTSINGFICESLLGRAPHYPPPEWSGDFDGEVFFKKSRNAILTLVKKDNFTIAVKKIYAYDPFGFLTAQEDAERFELLKKIVAQPGEKTFEVNDIEYFVGVDSQSGRTTNGLIAPFLPGRSVHSLLLDPEISHAVKSQIRKQYETQLKNLLSRWPEGMAELKKAPRDYFADGELDHLPALYGYLPNGSKLQVVLIKTDNIQVDPYDLSKMTIIDPY